VIGLRSEIFALAGMPRVMLEHRPRGGGWLGLDQNLQRLVGVDDGNLVAVGTGDKLPAVFCSLNNQIFNLFTIDNLVKTKQNNLFMQSEF